MKLEYINDCILSLTIDGIPTIDIPIDEFKKVIHQLIDRESDLGTLQNIWIHLMEQQGEYEDIGYCEYCEDLVTKYTLEI